jgi:hypothetical protein
MDNYYAPKCTPHFLPPLPNINWLGDGDISVESFNPIAFLAIAPDETIAMLQQVAEYQLSPEQSFAAKTSALALSRKDEITILDLVQAWEHTPVLGAFAEQLRRVCLLGQ